MYINIQTWCVITKTHFSLRHVQGAANADLRLSGTTCGLAGALVRAASALRVLLRRALAIAIGMNTWDA